VITATIAISSVLLSALTFIAVQVGIRRTVKADYVGQLEQRVQYLEQEVKSLREENRALTRELIRKDLGNV
jgi:cell division protein FtsB